MKDQFDYRITKTSFSLRCSKVEVSTPSYFWLIYILSDRAFEADHEYLYFNPSKSSFHQNKIRKTSRVSFLPIMVTFFENLNNPSLIHFQSLRLFFSYSALKTAYKNLYLKVLVQKINFWHQKGSRYLQHPQPHFVNLSSFFVQAILLYFIHD
jgi:hypothetical protein